MSGLIEDENSTLPTSIQDAIRELWLRFDLDTVVHSTARLEEAITSEIARLESECDTLREIAAHPKPESPYDDKLFEAWDQTLAPFWKKRPDVVPIPFKLAASMAHKLNGVRGNAGGAMHIAKSLRAQLHAVQQERDVATEKLEKYKQSVVRQLQYDMRHLLERWGDGTEAAILLDGNDALRKERDLIACKARALAGALPKCHYCSAPATIDADDGYKICDDHLETCRADAESGDGTLEPIDLPYGKALREIKQIFDVRKKTT